LQGVAGAGLIPLSQATLLQINPPERHGHAMAVFGIGTILGPIMGPALGGWLTYDYSWRWVFYINLPVGVLCTLGILVFIRQTRNVHREASGFSNSELRSTCLALKRQFPAERIVPVALVPFSNHTSDEETAKYYAAKHAFVSNRLVSQFVDRKRTQDRNSLKWSVSNIGLALFAKMGGVPWRVKPSTNRCLIERPSVVIVCTVNR
jgi:MFS family permease